MVRSEHAVDAAGALPLVPEVGLELVDRRLGGGGVVVELLQQQPRGGRVVAQVQC